MRIQQLTMAGVLAGGVLLCAGQALADPVTIEFNYRPVVGTEGAVSDWITAFEAKNPDIKVKWVQAAGTRNEWQDRLVAQISAGTAPDITEFWGYFGRQLAQQNALLDLRPLVARDLSQADVDDVFPASWANTFIPSGPKAGMQFSQPRYINTLVTYFNADLFADAGLATPLQLDQSGQWTWETLRADAKKLTVSDGGKITQWGFMLPTNVPEWMQAWFWDGGGGFFDDKDPKRYIGDSDESVNAGRTLQEMVWSDRSTSPISNNPMWFAGKVAMRYEGLHTVFQFQDTIGQSFKWDLTRLAKGPASQSSVVFDDAFGILAGTKHPEEAWKFLKFITSREGQEILIRNQHLAPTRRSAARSYLALDPTHNLNAFVQNMADSRPSQVDWIPADSTQINVKVGDMLKSVFRDNKLSYAQGAQQLRPVVEQIIRDTGY